MDAAFDSENSWGLSLIMPLATLRCCCMPSALGLYRCNFFTNSLLNMMRLPATQIGSQIKLFVSMLQRIYEIWPPHLLSMDFFSFDHRVSVFKLESLWVLKSLWHDLIKFGQNYFLSVNHHMCFMDPNDRILFKACCRKQDIKAQCLERNLSLYLKLKKRAFSVIPTWTFTCNFK